MMRERACQLEGTDNQERAVVHESAESRERALGDEGTEASERKIRKWERLWRQASPDQVMLLRAEAVASGEEVESTCGLLRATSFGRAVSVEGRAAGPENGSESVPAGSEPSDARAPTNASEPNDRRAPSSESEPTGERAPNDLSADFGEPE